jgi:hypothetical protein
VLQSWLLAVLVSATTVHGESYLDASEKDYGFSDSPSSASFVRSEGFIIVNFGACNGCGRRVRLRGSDERSRKPLSIAVNTWSVRPCSHHPSTCDEPVA